MLNFFARKADAARASARWFAMVLATQVFTAIATGVAIGYVMMLLVIACFAFCGPNHPNLSVDLNTVFWLTSLLGIASTATGMMIVTAVEHHRIGRDGGWAIGLAVGGRTIEDTRDLSERRLLNIVDEVAIAFGTTPPAVLVLDNEDGINVFAAGLTPADSIICITLGALRHFERDELQAVVAHEMSHLTNGDTVIGTRMTATLLGLQSIRVLAETLFTLGHHTTEHDPKSSLEGYAMMVFGAVVWPMGLFGTIAATSLTLGLGRSRETMADAEAVAKVRNPIALSRAMRRISGHPNHGHLKHPMISLVAPMLFVERSRNHHWFSSHPPLAERIAAIDPAGDQRPIYSKNLSHAPTHNEAPKAAAIMERVFEGVSLSVDLKTQVTVDAKLAAAASLVVLSAISVCDGETLSSDYEFMRGWSQLGLGDANRINASELTPELIAHAVESLAALPAPQKQRMLVAIANTISGDASMSSEEERMLEEIQSVWTADC